MKRVSLDLSCIAGLVTVLVGSGGADELLNDVLVVLVDTPLKKWKIFPLRQTTV